MTIDPRYLEHLEFRCIGPTRGGRVVAVTGDPNNHSTFYFGACAGGVWKSDDAGQFWECISDGFFNTSAIGALAIAPSDSNVLYAGTGETTIRIDAMTVDVRRFGVPHGMDRWLRVAGAVARAVFAQVRQVHGAGVHR